ncbi:MAG: histidine kinase dimerization/phospho-acceptor domain-containing protein, partial [Pseudomonadota bacterium]
VTSLSLRYENEQLVDDLSKSRNDAESLNQELRAARDDAITALRARSNFLAVMSHEIRTPINGVLGLGELLRGTELSDQQRNFTRGILGSGKTLIAIVNDALDFSKVESGKLELETIAFQPASIVLSIESLLGASARQKDLAFNVAISDELQGRFLKATRLGYSKS